MGRSSPLEFERLLVGGVSGGVPAGSGMLADMMLLATAGEIPGIVVDAGGGACTGGLSIVTPRSLNRSSANDYFACQFAELRSSQMRRINRRFQKNANEIPLET